MIHSKFSKHNGYKLLLMGLLLIFQFHTAKASHYGAVDLKVTYVGSGPTDLKYDIELTVYKSCEPGGVPLDDTVTVTISSASLNYNSSKRMGTIRGEDTLDQLCPVPGITNLCRDPNSQYPGFTRRVYGATVTLPNRATDWQFVWNSSARNGGIVNLCQPFSQGITVVAELNNLARFDISTPVFTSDPFPYFCASTPPTLAQFQNGVVLSNLFDSVYVEPTYSLGNSAGACGPTGITADIPFVAPYTLTAPIASSTPYIVNSQTGSAFFSPNLAGKFVLAFKASQIEKGTNTILASTRRDVQVAVIPCNSTQPQMDSIPINVIGGDYSGGRLRVCAGQAVTFEINAQSQSVTNKVNLYCKNLNNTPGAIFNVTGQGTSQATGSYTWTPNFSFVGNTFLLSFEAVDSTCDVNQPILLRSFVNVLVEVLPVIDAGPDIFNYCNNANGGAKLFAIATPDANYRWSRLDGQPFASGEIDNPNIQSPTVYPNATTGYIVTTDSLPANACKNMDTVFVKIDTANSVHIIPLDRPYIQCSPDYLQLDVDVKGDKPRANYACGPGTPQGSPSSTTIGSGSAYSQAYSPFFGNGAISGKTQILLKRSELFAVGMKSTTLTALSLNFSALGSGGYENIRISLKCTKLDKLSKNDGFETGLVEVYNNPSIQNFTTSWNKFSFTTPYNWDTSQNLIVEICYNNTLPVTTAPEVVYTFANNTTMLRTYSLTDDACPLNGGTVLPFESVYRPFIQFEHYLAPETYFEYTWSEGNQLSDSTIQNPVAYVDKSTQYKVTIIGANGCPHSDSFEIFMPTHDYKLLPMDTSICEKEKINYRFKNIGGGAQFQWYENNYQFASTIDTPNKQAAVARPLQSGTYEVVITDSVGCKDTLIANVELRPFPNVNILNNDTTIKYGDEIQLLGSGGSLYQWSPEGSLNNPIIPNPIASPKENTMYYLQAVGLNGCSNIDSVLIKINNREDIFVPSAFTPNGDGKNEIFRVYNMSFHKLVEFRIFNRFGQQLYSTVNNNEGWDGTWKGVKQDVGTYFYIIRVGFPDGYEETYKGEVTLLR